MKFTKEYLQKLAIVATVLAVVFASGAALSQKLGLGPAEAQNAGQPSYEDKSINAVRAVKPAVVDIMGNSATSTNGEITTIGGTGFIIDPNGLIVSNSHVVQDSSINYTVVFADGREESAKVLGLDKYNDVALLKIDGSNLPTVRLGNSDNLETGQTVIAIGNSLGEYQNTVTRGVVSGLDRAVDAGSDSVSQTVQPRLQNMIQTDAAINPGNSGGPLINLDGEVIGMNTLIDTGGEGLGFAVSINTIKNSIDQLQKFGKVSRPYMGISFVTITKAVQTVKNLNTDQGAYVDSVVADSPADKAGIKAGDIIIEIDHKKLTQTNELDMMIGNYQAGNQVLVTLIRNGKTEDLPLILGQYGQ